MQSLKTVQFLYRLLEGSDNSNVDYATQLFSDEKNIDDE